MKALLTIRAQLLALVAAFALPSIVLFSYSLLDDVQHEVDDAKAQARTLAVITASDIDRVLNNNRSLLVQMSQRPMIQKMDGRHCDPILRDFRQLFPKSANMTVIDLNGTAICSAVPQPGGKPISIAKSPWFPRTQAADGLMVSDPFYGPITGRWVTVLTYPVHKGKGSRVGYLGLPLDLALYEPNLSSAPLDPGTVVGVVTAKGVMVWRNMEPEKWVGKNLSENPQVRDILALKDGEIESTGADGVRRFYAITPIGGVGWYAFVGIPVQATYAKLYDSLWRNALVGGGILLLIIGLAWMIARRIAKPVRALAWVAREVRKGEQQARAELAGPPEIREVAREFNDMLEVRTRTEAALRASEAKLSEALRISRLGNWEYEVASGEFIFNDQYYALLGGTVEQFGGYRQNAEAFVHRWVHAADVPRCKERIEQALHLGDEGAQIHDEARILCPDGSIRWLAVTFKPEMDEQGVTVRLIGAAQDITERKHAEESQRKLNRALKLLSDCNTTLVRAVDEAQLLEDICRLVVISGGYRMAWVGFAQHDEEKNIRPVAHFGDEGGYLEKLRISWGDVETGQGPTGMAIRTGRTFINSDTGIYPKYQLWRKAALEQGFRSSIALPLVGKKHVLGALSIYAEEAGTFEREEVQLLEEMAADLAFGIETLRTRAEHEEAERKLEYLAHHDVLTGLPNRVLLRDRFELAVAQADRNHRGVALIFLDLDNFKQVNDTLGHEFGDRLLVQVVERLHGCLRDSDTISRQGGDEFIVLLPNVNDSTVIAGIAQHINDVFNEPFEIEGYSINTTSSLGISLYPHDSRDLNMLMRNADTAMYQAKESGRNTYRFFSDQMNLDAQEQLYLQGQMRNALKNREFMLHYQPQIDIESECMVGAEALLRWKHPELGLIAPGRFIPLAERSGLIVQIGEWVLYEACRQAKAWHDQGRPLTMAVNLSVLQFKRGNLIDTVGQALRETGLPAGLLELELTESILLQDVELAIKMLQRLKEMGVKISIDDFGTGYSSLSYLKRLAVDKLKIDQSFVRDLNGERDSEAIVRAIIQLGHALQLKVIAEGVETSAQFDFLHQQHCDLAQGYLYSKPVAAEEFASLLGRERW